MTNYLQILTRTILERRFGVAIFRQGLPHGTVISRDFRRMGLSPRTVFDVGANVGQSAVEYAVSWPKATIFSFEPIASTFKELKQNTTRFRNINCYQLALGDVEEDSTVHLQERSELNSLAVAQSPAQGLGTEVVRVTTLDSFCAEKHVGHVDLLKIDTEGYDLRVLAGSERMLTEGRVDAVLVEVGFVGSGDRHVPVASVAVYLQARGFVLAGFYDQALVATGPSVMLQRANALFVRERS